MIKYIVKVLHNNNNNKGLKLTKPFTINQLEGIGCYDADIKNDKAIYKYANKLICKWNSQMVDYYKYTLLIDGMELEPDYYL